MNHTSPLTYSCLTRPFSAIASANDCCMGSSTTSPSGGIGWIGGGCTGDGSLGCPWGVASQNVHKELGQRVGGQF